MSDKVLKIGSCCYFCGASDANKNIILGKRKIITCQTCIACRAKPGIITSISPSLLQTINERLRFVNNSSMLSENTMLDLCYEFIIWLHKTLYKRPMFDLILCFDYPAEEEPSYRNFEFVINFVQYKEITKSPIRKFWDCLHDNQSIKSGSKLSRQMQNLLGGLSVR